MTAERLTPATARVGMRVVCVEGHSRLEVGKPYVISCADDHHIGVRGVDHGELAWFPERFIAAPTASPALPPMTPELLAALREWGAIAARIGPPSALPLRRLWDAIEATPGILPARAPQLTDTQATLRSEWWS